MNDKELGMEQYSIPKMQIGQREARMCNPCLSLAYFRKRRISPERRSYEYS